MIFLFFGERGKREREREGANVNWGLGRGYQMGDKSGIWRFYRRVWKNIFYERRDKERKRGVLERRKGEVIFFLKSFEGVEENSKFYGEMYFWDYGVGREIFGLRRRRDNIYYL